MSIKIGSVIAEIRWCRDEHGPAIEASVTRRVGYEVLPRWAFVFGWMWSRRGWISSRTWMRAEGYGGLGPFCWSLERYY